MVYIIFLPHGLSTALQYLPSQMMFTLLRKDSANSEEWLLNAYSELTLWALGIVMNKAQLRMHGTNTR